MVLKEIELFRKNILYWYDKNARILPWRDEPTPYRVWISEIMLQQTRVEAVKPYFERFMNEVKDIESLANIHEDKLLKLWEGLGYYNRARNLKKTAQVIVNNYHGEMPSNFEELIELPGIGPYTAGAIASIAFHNKVPAVDGNVLRVIARVAGNHGNINDVKVKREIETLVIKLLPEQRVGDFNQALMELGATICLPNGMPKCNECPLQSLCEAYKKDLITNIPLKSKQKKRRIEDRTIFVLNDQNKIAIRKRDGQGLLANLYEFPNVLGRLDEGQCKKQLEEWGMEQYRLVPLSPSKHIFSHIEWHMIGYLVLITKQTDLSDFIWTSKEEIIEQISIPTAFKEYTNYIKKLRN